MPPRESCQFRRQHSFSLIAKKEMRKRRRRRSVRDAEKCAPVTDHVSGASCPRRIKACVCMHIQLYTYQTCICLHFLYTQDILMVSAVSKILMVSHQDFAEISYFCRHLVSGMDPSQRPKLLHCCSWSCSDI